MSKPNFFASIDALNCLLQMDFDKPSKDIDLTLDLIELPFWLSFCSDKKTQTLKAFAQTELYNKDEKIAMEKGSLILDRSSGQASVKAVQEIGENMGVFYAACQKLSCFIQKKKLEPLYANLNPDEAGILLVKNNDELSWKVVSGRERPSLTVQTLFGGITMGRPYMDDFWERSELENLSLEEKIAAAEEGNMTAIAERLKKNKEEAEGKAEREIPMPEKPLSPEESRRQKQEADWKNRIQAALSYSREVSIEDIRNSDPELAKLQSYQIRRLLTDLKRELEPEGITVQRMMVNRKECYILN